MPVTTEERQQFLAEPNIAALSVVDRPGRGPLTVPIWYQYTPGGETWILTPEQSRKARLIAAAGRFTLMVERVEPTVRYVSVEGPVTATVPATRDLHHEIVARYLPPSKVEPYMAMAEADHGELVVISMAPQRWLSADLG